jgi:hypothetical protein
MTLKKIVSGGQTGVDRGALDAGLNKGFPVGGWCPAGRTAEDGRIPDRYPLLELPGAGYRQRTKRNVVDSDGTLIIYFDRLFGGTEATLGFCMKAHKPYLLIDATAVSVNRATRKVLGFLVDTNVARLNVAGPRASDASTAHGYTESLLMRVIEQQLADHEQAS